ncbi:uncharacterized protein [Amphiura filiformis]|uniref:uncharacterized protein n=1 Tax=Amphiura filiformis TaxID=82378 RepID=UPI003B20EAD2
MAFICVSNNSTIYMFLFLVLANAATLINRCTLGPSYWCEHFNKAQECSAIDYCINNVWSQVKVQESSVCKECITFTKEVKQTVDAGIKEDLIHVGRRLCDMMGSLQDVCISILRKEGPDVFEKLVNKLNPSQMCAVFGFCKIDKFNYDLPPVALPERTDIQSVAEIHGVVTIPEAADYCTDCKAFIGDAQNMLSNKTIQKQLIADLDQVCALLGSEYEAVCKLAVQAVAPQLIGEIAALLDPTSFCKTIQWCPSPGMPKRVKANDPCMDCSTFFKDTKDMLSDVTIQHELIVKISGVCDALGDYANVCTEALQTVVPIVLDFISSEVAPTDICNTINFCQSGEKLNLYKMAVKFKEQFTADMCTDCKMFFGDVQKELMDPNNQQTIISAVEQVCSLLGDLSSECQSLVEQYGSTVINALAQVLDPQNTCSTIGFCSSTPRLRLKAADPCTDCVAFFNDTKMMLSNATVQKEIQNELKMVCSLLGDLADQCNSLIDQYGPLVFDLLLPELDPSSICGTIGFCQGVDKQQMITALTKMIIKVKMLPTADLCTDCKMFMGDIQKVLMDPYNQKLIIAEVGQLCSLLGDLSTECETLLQQFGPTVINALVQALDPQSSCSTIGFCSGHMKLRVKAGDPCMDCKAFFNDTKMMLSNATTQKEILNELKMVCSLLGDLADQCNSLIDQYGPLVFDLLLPELDPTSICGTLGFCQGMDYEELIYPLAKVVIKLRTLPLADVCTDCKAFFTDVLQMLNTPANQQTIIAALEQVCPLLGSLSSECKSLLDQFGPVLFNVLTNWTPTDACNTINFCGGQLRLKLKTGDPCTDCKAFFNDTKMMLSNATVQKEILNELKMVCSLLGDLADQCNSLIDQYGPLVFDLLLPELDPSSICGTIGFCQGMDTTQMIAALTRVVIKVKMLPTADMCTDCKMFFGDVQKVLMDPNNQQTILSAVEQVCSLLGDLSSECQSLVEQYGSTVINAVAQVLDPQNTCNTIGFCGMLPKLRVKAGDPCTDCKAFFGDVKMMLSNATTQKEILNELKMVCSLLGDLADQCNSLIDQYGPLVFDLLLPELDPSSICGTIGFCQGVDTTQMIAALTRVVIKVKMLPTADMCTDCKMFFGDVQKVLMDPNNQQTILSAVEQVCSLLGDLSSECQSLVEQYGSTVINAVAQVLDPQNTCNTIGFCGMLPKLRVSTIYMF